MAETFKQRWHRWDQTANAFNAKAGAVFGVIFVIYLAGAIVLATWEAIDKTGWIRHDAETPVDMGGDWLQGEYRPCFGLLSSDGKQTSLTCSGDSLNTHQHVLPVEFWGRLERQERIKTRSGGTDRSADTLLGWKCQRLADSLKCWAQD